MCGPCTLWMINFPLKWAKNLGASCCWNGKKTKTKQEPPINKNTCMASASPSCNIYFFSTFTDKINNIAADNKINISDEAFALIYIIIIV